MKETGPKTSKNKEKEIIPGKDEESSAEQIEVEKILNIQKESLESLEPLFEEVELIANVIEEKSDEIIENNENPSLVKKIQQILEELRSKGENFLKQLSKHLASYPKGVAEAFREKYIATKSDHLYKRINKNNWGRRDF